MDSTLRITKRTDKAAWLRNKMRAGQLSESMKRILCALGYEPMVLALGGPANVYGRASYYGDTFCNYKTAKWTNHPNWILIGQYLTKKQWSREACQKACNITFFWEISNHLSNEKCRRILIAKIISRLS